MLPEGKAEDKNYQNKIQKKCQIIRKILDKYTSKI